MSRNWENTDKNANIVDLSELLDWLLPLKEKPPLDHQEIPISSFVDENGQLWLETDELGIFSVEFLMALVMPENFGGECNEHQ